MSELKGTDKYEHFNHYHEMTSNHELVDFGDGEFIANKMAVPLLKALNELGLKTRTHHIDENGGFFSILAGGEKDVSLILQTVNEGCSRDKYNGMTELLIQWKNPEELESYGIPQTFSTTFLPSRQNY